MSTMRVREWGSDCFGPSIVGVVFRCMAGQMTATNKAEAMGVKDEVEKRRGY